MEMSVPSLVLMLYLLSHRCTAENDSVQIRFDRTSYETFGNSVTVVVVVIGGNLTDDVSLSLVAENRSDAAGGSLAQLSVIPDTFTLSPSSLSHTSTLTLSPPHTFNVQFTIALYKHKEAGSVGSGDTSFGTDKIGETEVTFRVESTTSSVLPTPVTTQIQTFTTVMTSLDIESSMTSSDIEVSSDVELSMTSSDREILMTSFIESSSVQVIPTSEITPERTLPVTSLQETFAITSLIMPSQPSVTSSQSLHEARSTPTVLMTVASEESPPAATPRVSTSAPGTTAPEESSSTALGATSSAVLTSTTPDIGASTATSSGAGVSSVLPTSVTSRIQTFTMVMTSLDAESSMTSSDIEVSSNVELSMMSSDREILLTSSFIESSSVQATSSIIEITPQRTLPVTSLQETFAITSLIMPSQPSVTSSQLLREARSTPTVLMTVASEKSPPAATPRVSTSAPGTTAPEESSSTALGATSSAVLTSTTPDIGASTATSSGAGVSSVLQTPVTSRIQTFTMVMTSLDTESSMTSSDIEVSSNVELSMMSSDREILMTSSFIESSSVQVIPTSSIIEITPERTLPVTSLQETFAITSLIMPSQPLVTSSQSLREARSTPTVLMTVASEESPPAATPRVSTSAPGTTAPEETSSTALGATSSAVLTSTAPDIGASTATSSGAGVSSTVSMSTTALPSDDSSGRSSDSNATATIVAVVIVIVVILIIGIVAAIVAIVIVRKKRRTHTYYTAGPNANKFNHYIDIQVRTDEEMREKTPDSKDIPFFETSFIGNGNRGSTTVLNDAYGTSSFKCELEAAIKARSQSSQLDVTASDHTGNSTRRNCNSRSREE